MGSIESQSSDEVLLNCLSLLGVSEVGLAFAQCSRRFLFTKGIVVTYNDRSDKYSACEL